jgi:hypothetical protein
MKLSVWHLYAFVICTASPKARVWQTLNAFKDECDRIVQLFDSIKIDESRPLLSAVENSVVALVAAEGVACKNLATMKTVLSGHSKADLRRVQLQFFSIVSTWALHKLGRIANMSKQTSSARLDWLKKSKDEFKREHNIPDNVSFHLRPNDPMLQEVSQFVRSVFHGESQRTGLELRAILLHYTCDPRKKYQVLKFCHDQIMDEMKDKISGSVIPEAESAVRRRFEYEIDRIAREWS